jgi:hypothetical protein
LEDKAASVVVANGWIVHEWRKIKKEEKKGWETKSIYLVTLFLHGIESQSQRGNEVCVYIERRVCLLTLTKPRTTLKEAFPIVHSIYIELN